MYSRSNIATRREGDSSSASPPIAAPPRCATRRFTRGDVRCLLHLATGVEPSAALIAAVHQASHGHVEPALTLLADLVAAERRNQSPNQHVFKREAEHWIITYQGETARLRHAKGLLYLRCLLRQPGQRVQVTDFVGDGESDQASLERARLAVTKAIKIALARIEEAHPPLGRHLAATVRRGYACVYLPDPRTPIAWTE